VTVALADKKDVKPLPGTTEVLTEAEYHSEVATASGSR
jgi:hypothetical protein